MLSEIPRSDSLIRTNAKLNAPRQKTYVPIIAKSATNLFSCQHSPDVTGYGLFDLHRREFLFYKEYQDNDRYCGRHKRKVEYPHKPYEWKERKGRQRAYYGATTLIHREWCSPNARPTLLSCTDSLMSASRGAVLIPLLTLSADRTANTHLPSRLQGQRRAC